MKIDYVYFVFDTLSPLCVPGQIVGESESVLLA
jgi:hypothetical protein